MALSDFVLVRVHDRLRRLASAVHDGPELERIVLDRVPILVEKSEIELGESGSLATGLARLPGQCGACFGVVLVGLDAKALENQPQAEMVGWRRSAGDTVHDAVLGSRVCILGQSAEGNILDLTDRLQRFRTVGELETFEVAVSGRHPHDHVGARLERGWEYLRLKELFDDPIADQVIGPDSLRFPTGRIQPCFVYLP